VDTLSGVAFPQGETVMHATTHSLRSPFQVRHVPLSRPLVWLSRGWQDLAAHPLPSLAYGALVAALGAVVLIFNRHPYMIVASLSGFLLMGPIMTAGLCELSRCRDLGEPCDFDRSLRALRHNRAGLFGFARCLLGISVVWFLLSSMILQITLGSIAPSVTETIWGGVLGKLSNVQLLSYLGLGGILAAIVFAISIVSVPMILDLNADASTAMRTSLQVFWSDLPAILLWASIIVILVMIGFATMMIGMIVVVPLLGHATWQAYRDLVH
jgi:uncharacterized membrane protein